MRINQKLSAMLCASCVLVLLLTANVSAAQYQSYLYDNWGQSIPAPEAYTVDAIYSGQSFQLDSFDDPEDIVVSPNGDIYIVDKGRNDIIVVSSEFQFIRDIKSFQDDTGEQTFLQPTGVFVDGNGNLYVADSGNQRVVKLDHNLKLLKTFGRPQTDLLDAKAEFKPEKVIVDTIGNVYVVGYGIYQGLIKYDADGIFQGFFGGNKVEVTPDLVLKQFWKKMFTDEQAQATSRSLPIEYSNATIDGSDFIYAVVMQTKTSLDEIKKLNAQGKNVLRFSDIGTHYPRNDFGDIEKDYTATTTYKDNRMVDVAVGDDGIMAVLDGERGHVFLYDQDCNLLFTFGNKGSDRGDFNQPVSIARSGEKYLIVDSSKKCVMVYRPTVYAQQVKEAMAYYSDGKYIESVGLWENVLKKNSNYMLAYKSIGKAYLQQGDYQNAIYYFKNADDKAGYSSAYAEYRKEFIRKNILLIMIGILAVFAFIRILLRFIRKWLGLSTKKVKVVYR